MLNQSYTFTNEFQEAYNRRDLSLHKFLWKLEKGSIDTKLFIKSYLREKANAPFVEYEELK